MNDKSQSRASLFLFLLFFLGLAITVFAVVDLQWTHRFLVKTAPPARLGRSLP